MHETDRPAGMHLVMLVFVGGIDTDRLARALVQQPAGEKPYAGTDIQHAADRPAASNRVIAAALAR